MNNQADDFDQAEEEILTFSVSDEELEVVAAATVHGWAALSAAMLACTTSYKPGTCCY